MHFAGCWDMHTREDSIFILHNTVVTISAVRTIRDGCFSEELIISQLDDVFIRLHIARDGSCVSKACHVIHHGHFSEDYLLGAALAVHTLLGAFVCSEQGAFHASPLCARSLVGVD